MRGRRAGKMQEKKRGVVGTEIEGGRVKKNNKNGMKVGGAQERTSQSWKGWKLSQKPGDKEKGWKIVKVHRGQY